MARPESTKRWVVERFDGPSGLGLKEVPIPSLGRHDVLVKVHAISLNYHDVGTLRGHYQHASQGVVPVSDGSGVVLDIGHDVTAVQPGDRVTTTLSAWQSGPPEQHYIDRLLGNALNGVLQEYAVIPEQHLMPLPRTLSFIEGSTLPVAGLSAWNALFGAQGRPLLPGQWVVTQGTGGVSTFVVKFAKAVGANVVATTSTTAKAQKLQQLGADHVINYKEVPEWGEVAKSLTPNGQGADLVIEIGGGVSLKQSLNAVKLDGLISVVGLRGGATPTEQPVLLDMFFRFCTMRIAIVGPRCQFEDMNRFVEEKGIKPAIDDKVFTFEEVKDAFVHFEGMGHVGKVCIRVADDEV